MLYTDSFVCGYEETLQKHADVLQTTGAPYETPLVEEAEEPKLPPMKHWRDLPKDNAVEMGALGAATGAVPFGLIGALNADKGRGLRNGLKGILAGSLLGGGVGAGMGYMSGVTGHALPAAPIPEED